MILNLQNGESITIYENDDILKQLQLYIDPEIFNLLYNKFGQCESIKNLKDLYMITDIKELCGKKILYADYYDNYLLLKTNDNCILIAEIYSDSEDAIADINFYDENLLKKNIRYNRYLKKQLTIDNIIPQKIMNQINEEIKEENKKRLQQEKEKRYKEYLKLKEEFENEEKDKFINTSH